jgi:hypothetical protein
MAIKSQRPLSLSELKIRSRIRMTFARGALRRLD